MSDLSDVRVAVNLRAWFDFRLPPKDPAERAQRDALNRIIAEEAHKMQAGIGKRLMRNVMKRQQG